MNNQLVDVILTYLNMLVLFVPVWYLSLTALKERSMALRVCYIIFSAVVFYYWTYLAVLLNLLILFRLNKEELRALTAVERQLLTGRDIVVLVVKAALVWLAFTALNAVMATVLQRYGIEAQQQEIITQMYESDGLRLSYLLFTSVLIGPVVEEFVFRAFYYGTVLKKKLKPPVAAIMISLLFALLHNSVVAFLSFWLFSLYLCYVYEKKGFWAAVITHGIFNLITAAIILYNILAA
jgi:membrane protease YdiL (CAAX protease family)